MHFPFKTLVAISALSFVIVTNPPFQMRVAASRDDIKLCEFYPLSSFSMYSTFSDNPFCMHVTDSEGNLVGTRTNLGIQASDLKKTYERKLKDIRAAKKPPGGLMDMPLEMRQEAAAAAMALVMQRPEAVSGTASLAGKRLQLHEVMLTSGQDGIEKRDTVVAEITIPN